MSSIGKLKARITDDSVTRMKFVADSLNLLEKHGVDTSDPEIRKKLGLEPGADAQKIMKHWAASTVVVTLVM